MAETRARLSGDDHSGIACDSAAWAALRMRIMKRSITFVSSVVISAALVVEMTPVDGPPREPGLRVMFGASYQPRTHTRVPRGGNGASPATRTRTLESISNSVSMPTTESTRNTND